MPYVYMLECSDGTLYTGWTTNLDKRLAVHNSGKGAKYTRARLPVELAYCKSVDDRGMALREEYRIKHLSRKDKERLIEEYKGSTMEGLASE